MESPDFMDHRQAWRYFFDTVRPGIWAGLSRGDRRDVNTAERDYHERRRDRNGAVIHLGPDRVARLLDRLAPGVFWVEMVVRFGLISPNSGELPPPDDRR